MEQRYPIVASAILAGASPQPRNAATNGANLNQRTRCHYVYDVDTPCNKRQPGQGCGAIGGFTRINAILGASEQCIATHPSDMGVSLAALEAKVQVTGLDGDRTITFANYHRLAGDEPWADNTLRPAASSPRSTCRRRALRPTTPTSSCVTGEATPLRWCRSRSGSGWRRQDRRGADRDGRGGAQAVAPTRGGAAADRPRAGSRTF